MTMWIARFGQPILFYVYAFCRLFIQFLVLEEIGFYFMFLLGIFLLLYLLVCVLCDLDSLGKSFFENLHSPGSMGSY